MTSGDPVKKLCEELACPICLEYFKNPVNIFSCGHNFCQACLDQCWERNQASCPLCKVKVQKRDIKRNRPLANLVEIAKELESKKWRVCQRHQEPLNLFCKDDEAPICVLCDRSKEHKNHQVIPLEIWNSLETLKEEREKILAYKVDIARESQDLLEKTQREKEKAVAAFRLMRQFLEEQERNLLAKMEELEKEISAQGEEHLARLSEELSSLSKLIQEMEEKHQQPASELLQDIRSTLQRYKNKETLETSAAFPPALKLKIWDFCDINPLLEDVMKQFKDAVLLGLELQKGAGNTICTNSQVTTQGTTVTTDVTLDQETATCKLFLSEDWKSVRWEDKSQYLPANPERFSPRAYVLGFEEFTSGRHFWEVVVGGEGDWAVGVARKSVRRKGPVKIVPEEGIWAVGKWGGQYRAPNLTSSSDFLLSEKTKQVRVCLNFALNQVAFYNADTGGQICVFSDLPFSGETVLPFFYAFKEVHLRIAP